MGHGKKSLVQNDNSIDPKTMGYKRYGVDLTSSYLFWRSSRRASVEEDNLYTNIIPVTNKKKTQETSSSSKVKHFITYNAEIEVVSVEARPL